MSSNSFPMWTVFFPLHCWPWLSCCLSDPKVYRYLTDLSFHWKKGVWTTPNFEICLLPTKTSTSHLHVIFISKTILHPLSMFIILGNTSRRLYMQNNYVRPTFKTLMPMPFHGMAWFIGILIMAYHKSHIIRYHNPLHPGNHTRLERKKGPFFSKEKHRPKPSIPRFWPPLTWGISVDIFTQVSAREMHIVPVRIGGLAFGIDR